MSKPVGKGWPTRPSLHYNDSLFNVDIASPWWGFGLGLFIHSFVGGFLGNISGNVPIYW